MTVTELVATVGGSVLFIVLLALIKVKPLEISVWSWIARKLGKALNGETNDRLDKIEDSLQDHLKEEKEKDMLVARQRILRFADEMVEHKFHSKEHFEEIIRQAKEYNEYCSQHQDFKNDVTDMAQAAIKHQYEECLARGDFSVHKRKEEG